MKIWAILGFLSLGLYFYSAKIGITFLVLTILYILNDIGLFRSANLGKGYFRSTNVVYKEYIGDYKKIGNAFCELSDAAKEVNSKQMIGIYYDNPENMKDVNLCRAIVGVMSKTPLAEDKLASLGMKQTTLPDTECIQWYFKLKFYVLPLMLIGIKKFYGSLNEIMKDKSLQKVFSFDITKPIYSIEVCDQKTINFYIPLKNHEKFFHHSQDNLTKNE
jgi:hypothetical protein